MKTPTITMLTVLSNFMGKLVVGLFCVLELIGLHYIG